MQVSGPPNVSGCGDNASAWASKAPERYAIHLDQSTSQSWNEIDAVQLVGSVGANGTPVVTAQGDHHYGYGNWNTSRHRNCYSRIIIPVI